MTKIPELQPEDRRPRVLEFRRSKSKLIALTALSLLLAIGGASLAFERGASPHNRLFGIAAIAFFGLGVVYLILELFHSQRPVLTLTPDGFTLPRSFAELIAWGEVREVREVAIGRTRNLLVHLKAEAAQRLTPLRSYPWSRRNRPMRRAQLTIPLQLIDQNGFHISEIFQRQVAAAHARSTPSTNLSDEQAAAEAVVEPPVNASGLPVVTIALLILLTTIFGWELKSSIDPLMPGWSLAPPTLGADGAIFPSLIKEDHQWWRLATGPLLHAGFAHMLFNGFGLLLVGQLFERLVGPAWFAGTFVVSALCGAVLSLAVNPSNLIGVGASGGIVGLFAATIVSSFRFPSGTRRTTLQLRAAQMLIPALIPLARSVSGGTIDYAGHFGGAFGGAAMGTLLLFAWSKDRASPRFGYAAAVVAALYFITAASAVLPIREQRHLYALYKQLTPNWPTDLAEAKRRSAAALADHPRDPRAHIAHALALVDNRDLTGAEQELRSTLVDKEMLDSRAFPILEPGVRALLAAVLVEEGKRDDALDIAKPLCGKPLPVSLQPQFDKLALCAS